MSVETDTIALQDFTAKRILSRNLKETGAEVPEELRNLMDLPSAGASSGTATPMPRPATGN